MTTTVNRVIAADIATFEQLNGLTQLNGVPIDVIEARARPGSWSYGGFLGPQERLVDVLKNDWNNVHALGLTHVEIAEHLNRIIRTACQSYGGLGHAGEEKEISYDFSQVQNASMANLIAELNKTQKTICARFSKSVGSCVETIWKASGIYNKMKAFIESFAIIFQKTFNPSCTVSQLEIHLRCEAYSGHEEDIFKRGNQYSGDGAVVNEYNWCRDYTFTNRDTGESIKASYGVIEYIRRYGFYEGNVPCRVDPLKLISVLTGIKRTDLEAKILARLSQ